MGVNVIIIWECEIRKIQKNEEYRNIYLKTLYNSIEIYSAIVKDLFLNILR